MENSVEGRSPSIPGSTEEMWQGHQRVGKFLCQAVDRFHMGHEKNSNLNATNHQQSYKSCEVFGKENWQFCNQNPVLQES